MIVHHVFHLNGEEIFDGEGVSSPLKVKEVQDIFQKLIAIFR